MRTQRPDHVREGRSRLRIDLVPYLGAFTDSCVGLTHLLPRESKRRLSLAVVGSSYTRISKTHGSPSVVSPQDKTGALEAKNRCWKADVVHRKIQNSGTRFSTSMMFIYAYPPRQVRESPLYSHGY